MFNFNEQMMREKLVIFLHANEMEHPDWVVLNSDGVFRYDVHRGDPVDLTGAVTDREIIVIVPAEDVLMTTVTLPKMNRSRLAQALPYALEEQLVGDIDTMHFAQGETQLDDKLPVAVVSSEKMQAWTSLLQSWNIQADKMIPSTLALPVGNNTWEVLINDIAAVRTNAYHGFACDKNNIINMLDIALDSSEAKPECIHIHNYSGHAVADTAQLRTTVREELHDAGKLHSFMAKNASRLPAINLLQGTYRVKKSSYPQMGKLWRMLSYFAAAWVILLFLYPTVSYLILKYKASSINNQIEQIYKRHFPLSSSIVAPRDRMEEKLRNVSAQPGDNKMLFLLGYVSKGLLEYPNIRLKRFDFQNRQLTLELTSTSSEDFSGFTEFLTRQGLNVKQQNANMLGGRMNGIVVVE